MHESDHTIVEEWRPPEGYNVSGLISHLQGYFHNDPKALEIVSFLKTDFEDSKAELYIPQEQLDSALEMIETEVEHASQQPSNELKVMAALQISGNLENLYPKQK